MIGSRGGRFAAFAFGWLLVGLLFALHWVVLWVQASGKQSGADKALASEKRCVFVWFRHTDVCYVWVRQTGITLEHAHAHATHTHG